MMVLFQGRSCLDLHQKVLAKNGMLHRPGYHGRMGCDSWGCESY